LFWLNDRTNPNHLYDESLQTPEFKSFIEATLKQDQTQRLTLQEMFDHPFLTGYTAMSVEVKAELERLRNLFGK
jgi:hypothetical protein